MEARYSEKSKLSFGEKLIAFLMVVCGILLTANLTVVSNIRDDQAEYRKESNDRSDSIEAQSKRRDVIIYANINKLCGDVDMKKVDEEVKLLRSSVNILEAYLPERRKKPYNYMIK